MTIPSEIIVGALLLLLVAVTAAGVVVGLWMGERGRNRDLRWMASLEAAPAKDDGPELEHTDHPDQKALERAEIAAVEEGLRAELQREGRRVDDAEIRKEAVRIVSQYHVAPAEEDA